MEYKPSFADQLGTNYISHHGIKGQKWGVRRFEDASGHLTPAGKRRYGIQDARKYYKINRLQRAKEKTRDADKNERLSRRIRRVQTRSDRKHADLNRQDINIGRQIVAKNRRNWAAFNTAAKAGLTAAGAYALYQNPKTRALAPLAIAAGGAATLSSAKKLPYYTMEARRYKQVNPKGATQKGLTKKQKTLRKVGKAAVIAGLAGATGYAAIKSGAAKKLVDSGKSSLESRTGIKFGKRGNNTESNDSTTPKHDTSKRIIDMNRKAKRRQNIQNGSKRVRNNVKTYAQEKTKQVKNSVKDGIKSAIHKQVMKDVDTDDVRTWGNAVGNTRTAISNGKRYMQAANAVKNRDAVTAISSVTPEIIGNTNKLIEQGKNKVNRHRRKRKLE